MAETYPVHKVAGQDQQHGGAGMCQHEVNIHHPLRETTPLVRPCQEDGSGSHTQRPLVRRAGGRFTTGWSPQTALQGCLQERHDHEAMQHRQ